MNVKELKDFLATLPPEFDSYPLVITSNIEEIDEESFFLKHSPIASVMVDENNKEVEFYNQDNLDALDRLTKDKDDYDIDNPLPPTDSN